MRLREGLRCLMHYKTFARAGTVLEGAGRPVQESSRSIHIELVARMAPSCAADLKPSLIRPSCRNEETTAAAACSRPSRALLQIYVLRSYLLSPNRHASMLAA